MLQAYPADPDSRGSSACSFTYNAAERWLQASWRGYVAPHDAQRGADTYLQLAQHQPSPYLLNDNSLAQGPWFDSLDWLREVWMPHATRLGLRYVAHVQQANRHHDVLLLSGVCRLPFDLQIFRDVDDACEWLRHMRDAAPSLR